MFNFKKIFYPFFSNCTVTIIQNVFCEMYDCEMNVTTSTSTSTTESTSSLPWTSTESPPSTVSYLEIGLGIGIFLSFVMFAVFLGLIMYLKRRNYLPMRSAESPIQTLQRNQTETPSIEVGGIPGLSQNDIFGFSPENSSEMVSANFGPAIMAAIMTDVPLNNESNNTLANMTAIMTDVSLNDETNGRLEPSPSQEQENPIFEKVKKKRFKKLFNFRKQN